MAIRKTPWNEGSELPKRADFYLRKHGYAAIHEYFDGKQWFGCKYKGHVMTVMTKPHYDQSRRWKELLKNRLETE